MKDDSTCKRAVYCDFEISRDLEDALIEICSFCGKKVVYYKREGVIDDAKYLRDHKRDVLQPYGKDAKLFYKIHGTAGVERAMEWQNKVLEKGKMKNNREELRERRRFLRKRALGHKYIGGTYDPPPFVKKVGLQK